MIFFRALSVLMTLAIAIGCSDLYSQVSQIHISATVQNSLAEEFLEIVDSQKNEIKTVVKHFSEQAEIVNREVSSVEARISKLKAIKNAQDEAIKKILLPHQIKRLERFNELVAVTKEGFANSVANGVISLHLELSESEREQLRKVAVSARKEYRNTMINAQKAAIEKLKKGLPVEKQKKYSRYIENFFNGDGIIWKINDRNLDASESLPVTVIRNSNKEISDSAMKALIIESEK